jgi:omega-6 fatty acid desaturase (delta-12 desaturase)
MCGAALGVALIHIQHSFNPAYVIKLRHAWSRHASGLQGSSVAYIPEQLKWFTMGIEYHNLHHFSTKIPGYHLRQCYETCPKDLLPDTGVLTAQDMWESLKNVLYDDENNRFVTFAEDRPDYLEPLCKEENEG